MKDLFGRPYHVGSYFVWSGRHSSSTWLNVGRVISVHKDHMKVTKIESRDKWRGKWEARVSRTTKGDDAVIVEAESLPQEIREILIRAYSHG